MLRITTILVLTALCLTGCATSSVERIGTSNYQPAPAAAEILVFAADSLVKQPFEVVGYISYDNPGKYQVPGLGDAIEPLKLKAREIGANGIIIDALWGCSPPCRSQPVTGIEVQARAIRMNTASQ